MRAEDVFHNCLNEALSHCWMSQRIHVLLLAVRLVDFREQAIAWLNQVDLCRLHEGLDEGCLCENDRIFGNTKTEIYFICCTITETILSKVKTWPEFIRLKNELDPYVPPNTCVYM
jgi:hypothetical protein